MSDDAESEASASFSADGIAYLRPSWLIALSPLALLAGPLLFVLAQQAHAVVLTMFALLLPLAGILGLVWGRPTNLWPGREKGKLVVRPDGVFFDGARLATRAEIKGGLVVPGGLGRPTVRLDRGLLRVPLDVEVANADEGRALLRALGFDASQSTATFRTPSRVLTDTWYRLLGAAPIFVLCAILFSLRPQGPPIAFYGVLAALAAVGMLTRSRLDVGADGIHTSWLGLHKRFIPYREITGVSSYADTDVLSRNRFCGVALQLAGVETLRIPVAQANAFDCAERVGAALERIREAMASYQRNEVGASAALLDRGERSPGEWIRSLRAVGTGAAADHRTAPVLPEQLWRIVEDPAQTPELRAGAAVVLQSALGEEGSARLRAAASAVAEPRVRIAIEAAGGEDEAALEEALAALPREARRVG